MLAKIEILLKEYPNLNVSTWEDEIKTYEKSLNIKLEKFKIYINIGVILFKLGKLVSLLLRLKSP